MRTRVKDPAERARLKAERAAVREQMRRESRKDVYPEGEPRVVEVEGARELLTVGPDDPIWRVALGAFVEGVRLDAFEGKIVRIIPPHDATDDQVAEVRGAVAGAAAIRVMPRRRSAVVTEEKTQELTLVHKRVREVVLQMVEESNTRDRGALRAFCEQVMARAGI